MIEKLMWLAGKQNLIPADKLVHWTLGALLAFVAAVGPFFLGPVHAYPLLNAALSALFGGLVGANAAVLKEAYDEAHADKHTKDWLDAAVTLVGAATGVFGFIATIVLLTL